MRKETDQPLDSAGRAGKRKKNLLVGLAGQQNAGKSTTFNMLTGANQHIANYPGVTVDKKSGSYRDESGKVEVVDLPGTYSLTSFSLEERVSRDFLFSEKPDVLVNVLDASCLKRSLFFTFQLLEMGLPLVVGLNMMDVARQNGLKIDADKLSHSLGVEVIPTVGRRGKGKNELKQAIRRAADRPRGKVLEIIYDDLEPLIDDVRKKIEPHKSLTADHPARWLAVKLLEGDSEAEKIIKKHHSGAAVMNGLDDLRDKFEKQNGLSVADYLVSRREKLAAKIMEICVKDTGAGRATISEKIDRVVLNPIAAPLFLVATVFVIYQLSIVKGYELTQYTWPILAKIRAVAADLLPDAGLLHDPYVRSMGLWMVDSANTLLNYVPIFLILFALIAILEDSGYMARIAFILDKVFHVFGLHGQSTLPYILGGVFAGGCAVPGIMATKGIPDEKSRMATILTVPFMNCLAKIPLYTLLVNIYFVQYKSWVMLFLSTITILVALLVAKLLTATVLRNMETAPFIMELPNYHPPTIYGVGQRAVERTWVYVKKVGSIVVAVSIFVFTFLQFPGLGDERQRFYEQEMNTAVEQFYVKIADNPYAKQLGEKARLVNLINFYNDYKQGRLNIKGAEAAKSFDEKFKAKNPDFFLFIKPGKDKAAKKVNRALRKLASKRKTLRRKIKEETITVSILGQVGRAMEPVTRFAGFDWKINVALLSSFAARESSVATLGVLFQQGADESKTLEERMGAETVSGGFTPLHALAVMVFFALYPPCLAATIMVKVQTHSYKWMLFSIFFPTTLGLVTASSIFTLGRALDISGITMMGIFYGLVALTTLVVGVAGGRHESLPEYTYQAGQPESV